MLTVNNVVKDNDSTITTYDCNFIAECDGSSIWSDTTNKKVRVTGICIVERKFEEHTYKDVNVTHDSTWVIYTDKGFERAISKALGYKVRFTEQGMQDDNYASME